MQNVHDRFIDESSTKKVCTSLATRPLRLGFRPPVGVECGVETSGEEGVGETFKSKVSPGDPVSGTANRALRRVGYKHEKMGEG